MWRCCWLQGMIQVPQEEDVRASILRHEGIEDKEVRVWRHGLLLASDMHSCHLLSIYSTDGRITCHTA